MFIGIDHRRDAQEEMTSSPKQAERVLRPWSQEEGEAEGNFLRRRQENCHELKARMITYWVWGWP